MMIAISWSKRFFHNLDPAYCKFMLDTSTNVKEQSKKFKL